MPEVGASQLSSQLVRKGMFSIDLDVLQLIKLLGGRKNFNCNGWVVPIPAVKFCTSGIFFPFSLNIYTHQQAFSPHMNDKKCKLSPTSITRHALSPLLPIILSASHLIPHLPGFAGNTTVLVRSLSPRWIALTFSVGYIIWAEASQSSRLNEHHSFVWYGRGTIMIHQPCRIPVNWGLLEITC